MTPFLASAPTAHSHLCVCVCPSIQATWFWALIKLISIKVYHSSQSTRSFQKEREKSCKLMGYQSPILENGENLIQEKKEIVEYQQSHIHVQGLPIEGLILGGHLFQ